MTTTNNLIEQVGGIEKAKAIVEGAPETSQFWRDMDSICSPNEILYYAWFGGALLVFEDGKGWIKSIYHDGSEYILDQLQGLDDLRIAIAQHESNNHQETSRCNKSGNCEKRFNSSEAIKQLESDHITDIRNHISPNTKVVEL